MLQLAPKLFPLDFRRFLDPAKNSSATHELSQKSPHICRQVFLPSDNQECILRGLLDHVQAQDELLPTFVAHMSCDLDKLKSPPLEKDRIDLISKHALEKYGVALYGANITSVMGLLLWTT